MQFTLVIFSTYKFAQESLEIEKSARTIFMSKNVVVLNVMSLIYKGLLKFINIFLLKELFFTSPQLKITLFKTVFKQFMLIICFCYSKIGIMVNLLNKEKSYVSTYSS